MRIDHIGAVMKKKIRLLCLCIIALCISFPHASNVIEIDASKDYSNGIKGVPIGNDVRFILSPDESVLLSHIELPELNTGLYFCYYGVGYGIADTSVLISYKYENWYNLHRQYDRANDSATFAKKMNQGWCITLGSPDTIWKNSLHYPDTVIGCDTFLFYGQGENEMTYFRARPILEYYEYDPPLPEPSVHTDTTYPEYSIIQYIAAKCLDFTRHMKIQVAYINHSQYPHNLHLRWAVDGPQGDGIFKNDPVNINNPYIEKNNNEAFPKFSKIKNCIYFHDILPNTKACLYNLQGVLMKSERLSSKNRGITLNVSRGMYILSVVNSKKRYSTTILIR